MDDAEQFLPHYLRFVKGIIDCNDLPLNVSREILQNHRLVDTIKTALTKRVLSMLEELASQDKEKYQSFWNEFGQVLKEGLIEDYSNKEQAASLLRFSTTYANSEKQDVSLEEYIARMPGEQSKIYYITAQTFNAAKNSPHLEIFRNKGIEVLLLTERIDEWLVTHLTTFKDKPLQSVAKGDLGELAGESNEEENKQIESDFTEILAKVKEILKDKIKEVRLSRRLTDSPACIVADEQDLSTQMEKIMRAAGQVVPVHKPILELNANHLMIKQLKREENQTKFEDLAHVLLDQAILAEGGQLEDPMSFVQRFNKLLLELTN